MPHIVACTVNMITIVIDDQIIIDASRESSVVNNEEQSDAPSRGITFTIIMTIMFIVKATNSEHFLLQKQNKQFLSLEF